MPLYQWLSMLSVIVMALAFWRSTSIDGNINTVFALQIAGYLLWAVASWLAGVRSAALVFTICAITLTLRMLRRFPSLVMFSFLAATLAACLIVNNSGWMGILPILAGMGVIYRHAFGQAGSLTREERRRSFTFLNKMDNAYRLPDNALGLFLHNIVGVALWGAYARMIGDGFMLCWRAFMLAVNVFNYVARFWPSASRALARAIPDPNRRMRRKLPGQGRKRDWRI